MAHEQGRSPAAPLTFLKVALLASWAVWLTVVLVTNLMDAAKALHLLRPEWPFASGNYAFLTHVTGKYDTPEWVNGVLFAGVIAWEAAATALFWAACLTHRGRRGVMVRHAAFVVALGLWMAFAVADEVFIAYDVERAHVQLFIAQLATLLAVELLPEGPPPERPLPDRTGVL